MGKIRYLLNKSVPFQCSRAQQLSSFVDKGLCGKRVLLLLLPALKFLLRHVSWIFVMKGLFDSFFFSVLSWDKSNFYVQSCKWDDFMLKMLYSYDTIEWFLIAFPSKFVMLWCCIEMRFLIITPFVKCIFWGRQKIFADKGLVLILSHLVQLHCAVNLNIYKLTTK